MRQRKGLILNQTSRDCLRKPLSVIATLWGALNNSDRSCMGTPIPNGKLHHQTPSTWQRCKAHPTCQSLQVSALHEEQDNQLLRKERDLPIHLPCIFHRQEILKGFKSPSLVVYIDPATDMLPGPATCQLCPTYPKRKL